MRVTSEGPTRITKATIDSVWRRRSPGNRLLIRDMECRGLALVVNPTAMRWEYASRPRGTDPVTGRRWPNRTVTLGNPETHSPEDARAEANRIEGQAAAGADPAAEKKAQAEAEQRQRASTLTRLLGKICADISEPPQDARRRQALAGVCLQRTREHPSGIDRDAGWRHARQQAGLVRGPQLTVDLVRPSRPCAVRRTLQVPRLVPGLGSHCGQPMRLNRAQSPPQGAPGSGALMNLEEWRGSGVQRRGCATRFGATSPGS